MPSTENIHEQDYLSRPAPMSHFFTTVGSYTQSVSQAFGPEDGNLSNRFRITAKFTSTGAKAFACCKGVVLIQPQAGSSTKVNLILRPYTQPMQGIQIKYFVYRGLNKSDFFNNDLVLASTGSTSDLINKVNADYIAFHTTPNNDPIPPFQAKFLGFNPTEQLDAMLLDDIFFKQAQYTIVNGQQVEVPLTAYELPMIDIGKSLGSFAAGDCGIDIVLNYGDYKLPVSEGGFIFDLAYARKPECYIDLVGATTDYEKKVRREQICQFLDAAAFYGAHFTEGGIVVTDNNGIKENKKLAEIYDQVIQNFYSKNRLYLYIQSDRGRSYNFYENYLVQANSPESLKVGIAESSLSAISFNEHGWPLLMDELSRTHNEPLNKLYLQFATDNNPNTALYGQVAQIENAQKNNFCSAANLSLPPDINGVFGRLTRIITISYPAVDVGGQKKNIAGFNLLIFGGIKSKYFLGQVADEQNILTNIFEPYGNIDGLFGDLNAELMYKTENNQNYILLASERLTVFNFLNIKNSLGLAALKTTILCPSGVFAIVNLHNK